MVPARVVPCEGFESPTYCLEGSCCSQDRDLAAIRVGQQHLPIEWSCYRAAAIVRARRWLGSYGRQDRKSVRRSAWGGHPRY